MLSGFWNGGVGCSIEVLAELMGDTRAQIDDPLPPLATEPQLEIGPTLASKLAGHASLSAEGVVIGRLQLQPGQAARQRRPPVGRATLGRFVFWLQAGGPHENLHLVCFATVTTRSTTESTFFSCWSPRFGLPRGLATDPEVRKPQDADQPP